MKKALVWLLVAALGLSSFALGEAFVFNDKQDYYDDLLVDFGAGLFDSVLEIYADMQNDFENGGSYMEASAYSSYAEGMLALEKENFAGALGIFKTLSSISPNFPEDYKNYNTCQSLAHYAQGRVHELNGEYALAVESYTLAGNCRDNAKRIMALNEIIDGISRLPKRVSIEEINTTANSIELIWKDSEASASYTVECAPAGGKNVYSGTVEACALKLESLLPDTSYGFKITIDDAGETFMCTAATQSAPPLAGDMILSAKMRLFYCPSADITRYGIEKAISRKLDVYPEDAGAGYPLEVNKGRANGLNAYYINVKLNNLAGKDLQGDVEWMLVLRLDEGGAYACKGTMKPPRNARVATNYALDMANLLSAAYEGMGEWKAAHGEVELYVNGMFTDEIEVQLTL